MKYLSVHFSNNRSNSIILDNQCNALISTRVANCHPVKIPGNSIPLRYLTLYVSYIICLNNVIWP